ncbi:MAG TPA: hypothetical protein VFP84_37220 [Kofleriaceae bacterium]|nr:hypothetical protein [Kofleriaceae bacterium]
MKGDGVAKPTCTGPARQVEHSPGVTVDHQRERGAQVYRARRLGGDDRSTAMITRRRWSRLTTAFGGCDRVRHRGGLVIAFGTGAVIPLDGEHRSRALSSFNATSCAVAEQLGRWWCGLTRGTQSVRADHCAGFALQIKVLPIQLS